MTKVINTSSYPGNIDNSKHYKHGQVFPSSAKASSTESIRTSVLNEANKIVNGARNKQYGSPEDNFKNIADLWNGYLGTSITPGDVANLMALMKIARLKYSPDHRDSWVDLAGYAACGAEIGLK